MGEEASCEVVLDEIPLVVREERGVGKRARVPSCVEGGQKTPGDLGVLILLRQRHQIRSSWLRPQLPEMDDV